MERCLTRVFAAAVAALSVHVGPRYGWLLRRGRACCLLGGRLERAGGLGHDLSLRRGCLPRQHGHCRKDERKTPHQPRPLQVIKRPPPESNGALTFGRERQVSASASRRGSVGLGGQRWGGQRCPILVGRRELEGRLVVGQGHSRREVHLDAIMDVLLLDQASWGRYTRQGQTHTQVKHAHTHTHTQPAAAAGCYANYGSDQQGAQQQQLTCVREAETNCKKQGTGCG